MILIINNTNNLFKKKTKFPNLLQPKAPEQQHWPTASNPPLPSWTIFSSDILTELVPSCPTTDLDPWTLSRLSTTRRSWYCRVNCDHFSFVRVTSSQLGLSSLELSETACRSKDCNVKFDRRSCDNTCITYNIHNTR